MVMIGAAAAAGVAIGLVIVRRGVLAPATRTPRRSGSWSRAQSILQAMALATAAAALVLALTGWPVAAVTAAAATAFAPARLRARRSQHDEVERIEAVASWTEMLRDTLAAAAGLEEAVRTTAGSAPSAIADEVGRLASRLHRTPLPDALRRFADEVANPAADLVVAALVVAAEREARDLAPLLGALARSARTEAEMRRRVEVGRVRIRTAARVVTVTLGLFGLGLVAFSRPYLAPYGTVTGQLVLLVVLSIFAAGWWLLDRMSRIDPPERFFTAEEVG